MDVGSVGYIKRLRNAISIARLVMKYTNHTLLVGSGAEDFAIMMGVPLISATTDQTTQEFNVWKSGNCQPNYFANIGQATSKCPPYPPPISEDEPPIKYQKKILKKNNNKKNNNRVKFPANQFDHDTIGMITMDENGSMACGTTTNGANHKVAGRVGDSPIVGAGCYVNSKVGGAAATGDGDTMMRFLPSFYAVTLMEQGMSPADACSLSIQRIENSYPSFSGGLVCINNQGVHAGAAHNMPFTYSYMNQTMTEVLVVNVTNQDPIAKTLN